MAIFMSKVGDSKNALKTYIEFIALDITVENRNKIITPFYVSEIQKNAIASDILYSNFDSFIVAVLDKFLNDIPCLYYNPERIANIIKTNLNR